MSNVETDLIDEAITYLTDPELDDPDQTPMHFFVLFACIECWDQLTPNDKYKIALKFRAAGSLLEACGMTNVTDKFEAVLSTNEGVAEYMPVATNEEDARENMLNEFVNEMTHRQIPDQDSDEEKDAMARTNFGSDLTTPTLASDVENVRSSFLEAWVGRIVQMAEEFVAGVADPLDPEERAADREIFNTDFGRRETLTRLEMEKMALVPNLKSKIRNAHHGVQRDFVDGALRVQRYLDAQKQLQELKRARRNRRQRTKSRGRDRDREIGGRRSRSGSRSRTRVSRPDSTASGGLVEKSAKIDDDGDTTMGGMA